MSARPLLAICIPTYNRALPLQECLFSGLLSASGYEEHLEIVISDNASNDDTPRLVDSIIRRYPWIRHYRQQHNIGGDRNFRFLINMAASNHVWIFSDDDHMQKQAIPRALEHIRRGALLIVFNWSVWTKNFSSQIKASMFSPQDDMEFYDANSLVKQLGFNVSLVSCFIARKTAYCNEYTELINTRYAHVYAVYASMYEQCFAVYISDALVEARSGNISDADYPARMQCLISGSSMVFDALEMKGYSPQIIKSMRQDILKSLIGQIISVKLQTHPPFEIEMSNVYRHFSQHVLFWICFVPLFYLPRTIYEYLRRLKHFFLLGADNEKQKGDTPR